MPGEIKLDTRAFSLALKDALEWTRRDAATLLNNAMGDVALRSIKLTKRADAAAMDKLLVKSRRGRMLKSGRRSKSKRNQEILPTGYVFAVINYYRSHGRMPPFAFGVMPKVLTQVQLNTQADITRAAQFYVRAKKRSIAYIALGFVMAARFFGKTVTTKISTKGWAAASTGKKATPNNLTVKMMNYSRGADKAPGIRQAVQTALDSVTADMMQHVAKKVKARWEKRQAVVAQFAAAPTLNMNP